MFYKEEPFLKENEELKKIMLHFIGSKENVDILEVGATNDFFKKELLKHKNISSYTTLNLDYFSGVDIIKDINEYTTDKKYDLVFFSFTVDNYIKELQLNKYKKLLKDDGVLVFISAKNVRDVLIKKMMPELQLYEHPVLRQKCKVFNDKNIAGLINKNYIIYYLS